MSQLNFPEMMEDLRVEFASGRTRDVKFRKTQLRSLHRMYTENIDTFLSALATDLGKPRQESLILELNVLIDDINYILNHIDDWVKPEHVAKNMVTIFDKPLVYHEPVGVVLVMGAWNYPMMLPLMPMSGAIAAGNCAVLKPSELAPATGQAIAKLLPQYIDKRCYRVVVGGIPETTALLKERFDHIFFTGSTSVGRIVHAAANKHLTPVTLELGGKSPLYIDDTVDLDVSIRRILWGKLINAGQTCIAPDYLLCSRALQPRILDKAKQVLKDFYGDDPKKSVDYGRIISQRHVERISKYLTEGKLEIGGQFDVDDRYVAPTILTNVPLDSKVMTEEIFGPVLPIINVESPEEAVEFINAREGVLVCYVFTSKQDVVDEFVERTLHVGVITVNDTILQHAIHGLPFGGVGNSGMGQYHGHASFLTFTHRKSCLHRNFNKLVDLIGSRRYPPYNDWNANLLSNMMRERWLPSLHFLPHLLCFGLGVAATFAFRAISQEVSGGDK